MLIFIIQIGYRASVYFGDEETQKVGQIVVLASMCLTQIKVSGLNHNVDKMGIMACLETGRWAGVGHVFPTDRMRVMGYCLSYQ